MTLVREPLYDEVHHSQSHFRELLDSMARPGKVNTLEELNVSPPAGVLKSTAYVCLALLNRDVSYYHSNGSNAIEEYLRINTGCTYAELEEADFIVAKGSDMPEMVEFAKEGILTYPETGASLILEVDHVSEEEISPAIKLGLSGPGVDGKRIIWVAGWQCSWVQSLNEKNCEYPLGVDTILSFETPRGEARICCIPRSTKIEIL